MYPKTQSCPYCDNPVEDCHANWEDEEIEVTCDNPRCGKKYTVSPKYEFLGFEVKRMCQKCGFEMDEDENVLTDLCDDCEDKYLTKDEDEEEC